MQLWIHHKINEVDQRKATSSTKISVLANNWQCEIDRIQRGNDQWTNTIDNRDSFQHWQCLRILIYIQIRQKIGGDDNKDWKNGEEQIKEGNVVGNFVFFFKIVCQFIVTRCFKINSNQNLKNIYIYLPNKRKIEKF